MMEPLTIDYAKFEQITTLKPGSHRRASDGMCVMEAVAFVRGLPHSDHPPCVSSVIGVFMRQWNDSLPDDETRTRLLKPLIPVLVGTASSPALEERRALMCADWLVRTHTLAWLRLAGLTAQAERLEALPEITALAQAAPLRPVLYARPTGCAPNFSASTQRAPSSSAAEAFRRGRRYERGR